MRRRNRKITCAVVLMGALAAASRSAGRAPDRSPDPTATSTVPLQSQVGRAVPAFFRNAGDNARLKTAGTARPTWLSPRGARNLAVDGGVAAHPVFVTPTWPLPADLPLRDGQLVCTTCHQPGSDGRPGALRGQADGSNFCDQCHARPEAPFIAHASLLTEAHPGGDSMRRSRHGGGTIDEQSRRCLRCHDGTVASDKSSVTAPMAPGIGGLAASHPIGKRQPDVRRPRGAKSRYVPRARVADWIRFYDGRVGCGSCHNVYSNRRGHLVTERTDDLCFACHDM